MLSNLTSFVALLLPHLHALDSHLSVGSLGLGILLPGLRPFIPVVPERYTGVGAAVNPRLVIFAVFEPAVAASNSDVENEVERLVEWGRRATIISPGVDVGSAVGHGQGEIATSPERFLELPVEMVSLVSAYSASVTYV